MPPVAGLPEPLATDLGDYLDKVAAGKAALADVSAKQGAVDAAQAALDASKLANAADLAAVADARAKVESDLDHLQTGSVVAPPPPPPPPSPAVSENATPAARPASRSRR